MGFDNGMQTEPNGNSSTVELNGIDRLWVLMLLAPIAMDYRFDDNAAGSIGLYSIVLGLNLFGAWRLVDRYGLPAGNALAATLVAAIIFVVTALVGGLLDGSDLVSLLRTGSSLVVYVVVLIGVAALSRSGIHPGAVWRLALAMAVVGLLFQLLMVAWLRGVNFATLRYEVLTGGTPALAALVVVAAVYGGWRPRYVLYTALLAFLIFISITRTYLLSTAITLAVLVLVAPVRALSQRSFVRALQIAPLIVLAVLAIDTVFPVSQLDRWWGRLVSDTTSHRGIDVTEITRFGEASYQLQRLADSTTGFLVGFGPAAKTRFDDQATAIVTLFLGEYGSTWRGGGFGHNNYVGTFFVGGIVAGTLLLLSQFLALAQVPVLLRQLGRMTHGEERLLLMSIPAALVGYMTIGLLSGTMGARSSAALFAASIALVWWLKARLKLGAVEAAILAQPAPARRTLQPELRRLPLHANLLEHDLLVQHSTANPDQR